MEKMSLTLGPLASLRHGGDISQYIEEENNVSQNCFDDNTIEVNIGIKNKNRVDEILIELDIDVKKIPFVLSDRDKNKWDRIYNTSNTPEKSENISYCMRAFDHLQLMDNGNILPCCPPWINHYSIGNINEQSYEEIWNGEKAQDFRRSILDGSYKFCNENSCPHLRTKTGPLNDNNWSENIQNDIANKKVVLDHGPEEIQFCYDRSCNLSCPSCRDDVIMVDKKTRAIYLKMQEQLQSSFLKDAKTLVITGSGDAFASPVFRQFLQTLEKHQAPNIDCIVILTNGLLVKKYWHTLSDYTKEKIKVISVSIDAATKGTYLINRRGGSWELLHENLKFIQNLDNVKLYTSMVVQDNNFKEIIPFVEMSKKYNTRHVQLQIIEPDFHHGKPNYIEHWLQKAVHERVHRNHAELLKVIKDPYFDEYLN